MSRHHERERGLQTRIEAMLGEAMPEIDVLDVELDDVRETVRVFVDTPTGVGLDTCADVTAAIRDTCPDHALEVSSPGIERPLRYRRHFDEAVGATVRMREDGSRRAHVYTVVDVDDEHVTVRAGDGAEHQVGFADIVRCRLVDGAGAQRQEGRA